MSFGVTFAGSAVFFALGTNGWDWTFAESGNTQPFTGIQMEMGLYFLNVNSLQTNITAYTSGNPCQAWVNIVDALRGE